MSKKIFFGGVILSLLLFPYFSLAFTVSDFTNHGANDDFFYPATWNNLVLDFTIPNLKDDGTVDILETLTVKNNGGARDLFEITAVKLWSDDYLEGWQGWGYDNELAIANYSNNSWYFDDLALEVPEAGLRFFVTIDARLSIADKKTVQFYIPKFTDYNSDGDWDLSDQGIFMASGINGPIDGNLMNENLQAINATTYDVWSPEAVITNLDNNQNLEGVTSYTIMGEAKDQGRSDVSWVKIGVGTNEDNLSWFVVENTGVDYSTWSYQWQNITPGNYVLKTQSRDTSGNLSGFSYPLNITVTEAAEEEPDEDGEEEEPTELLADGTLIKGSDPKVYVISNNQKRWITSGEIFEGLGYQWNEINVVSDDHLALYETGANIIITYRHPDGTLIKYQTYPEVFLLEDGYRRHIANEETFLGLGYQWDDIITIPDWESYPDGEEIWL